MNEVGRLRQSLRQKEVAYRANLEKESDELNDQLTSFLKKLGIVVGVLILGYTVTKLVSNSKKKRHSAVLNSSELETMPERQGFSIPKSFRQKLITMLLQIGLTILTSKVKAKLETGLDNESPSNS